VLGVGRLPSTGSRPLRYLVLGALVNDDGDLVETATEYLARNPARARDVGRQLGAELQHMHEARCPTGFGNFADSPGAGRTYDSWNSYLEDFLVQHASYVKALGVAGCQVEKARAFIRRCGYVDEPRYLHGDVSIRNIAMRSYDPVSISLLDPNPLAGDPSWDIAPMTNNVEFSGRRHRADGGASDTLALDSDIVAGFWEFYPHVIAHSSLLTAQLVQAVLQAQHRQRASHFGDTDDLDVEVVHEFIRDVMDRMSE
jgi:aminoglycoside phosphotransferase (APT) family kinase protein